ncbi:MAG: Ig-like domain-containing protein, partial [Chlorobiales bacterium]|nr:Ig-like domain-containing protein [Chlorobiales bacterium]
MAKILHQAPAVEVYHRQSGGKQSGQISVETFADNFAELSGQGFIIIVDGTRLTPSNARIEIRDGRLIVKYQGRVVLDIALDAVTGEVSWGNGWYSIEAEAIEEEGGLPVLPLLGGALGIGGGVALAATSDGDGDNNGATAPAQPAAPTSPEPVTDDTTPGITIGTGLIGEPKLYIDGVEVPSTYDPVTGTLTPDTPLGDGTYDVTYTLTDAAGNESPASDPLTIEIDTTDSTQPAAPTSTEPVTGDTTPGIIIGAGLIGEPKLYIDGVEVASTYDPVTGVLTPDTPLGDGTYDVTYTLTDAAGNESPASDPLTIEIDTTAPVQTITIDSITEDTGIAGDFITSDSDGLTVHATLSGVLGAGEVLMYSTDGGTTWVDISGSVTGTSVRYADTGLTSTATVQMRVEDAVGNAGAEASQLVTVDTTAPLQTITIDSITEDTGTAGDFITGDSDGLTVHATLSGALGTGESLMYSTDGGTTWVDISGSVTGTSVSHADGSLTSTATVQMRVEDGANAGATVSQLVTIDTTAPVQTITIDSIVNDTGTAGDFITSDNDGLTVNATLSGVLGAGEVLMYSTDGGTTWVDISGSVTGTSVSYADTGLTGTATVQMRVEDAVGNAGATASQLVTIDTAAPTMTIAGNGGTGTITFTFSKAPVGFELSDIVISNGTAAGPLTQVNTLEY